MHNRVEYRDPSKRSSNQMTHIKEVLEARTGNLSNGVPSAERSERVRDCGLSGGEGELREG